MITLEDYCLHNNKDFLLTEWSSKNSLKPSEIPHNINQKFFWNCRECGHSWSALLHNRKIKGQGCPDCKNKIIKESRRINAVKKYGSLNQTHPHISSKWHARKNLPLTPDNVCYKTKKKFWWVCDCGEEWFGIIDLRRKDCFTCKKCGHAKLSKSNSKRALERNGALHKSHPIIAQQLNEELNLILLNVNSSTLHSGSQCKVWWKCSFCGENYLETPYKRISSGASCNIRSCLNVRMGEKARERALSKKENLLINYSPKIAHEYAKDLNPHDLNSVTYGSPLKVWWRCNSCSYEWQSVVKNRVKQESGCPSCSGKAPIVGVNDFATVAPHLLEFYIHSLNELDSPTNVLHRSHKKALWKCDNGHETVKSFGEMFVSPGCGKCSTSILEKEVINYVSSIIPLGKLLLHDRKIISPMELDIVIPKHKIAIEVNGDYYHSNKRIMDNKGISAFDFHYNKFNRCLDYGYLLLTVWESDWNRDESRVKKSLSNAIDIGIIDSSLVRFTNG